jgi:hypothetical protein
MKDTVYYNIIEITSKSDKILKAQVKDPEAFVAMQYPELTIEPEYHDDYIAWNTTEGQTKIEAIPVRDLTLNILVSEHDYHRFMKM